MREFKFFAGRNNRRLAGKVAAGLEVELGKSEVVSFADGELKVRVAEEVREKVCFVFSSMSPRPGESLLEFLQFGQALEKMAAKKVVGVISYLAYMRQNQAHLAGEPITLSLVAKFMKTAGFDELVVLELHEETSTSLFEMPVRHLSGVEYMARRIRKARLHSGRPQGSQLQAGDVNGQWVVVSPDQGGVERARTVADVLRSGEVAVIEKKRDLNRPNVAQPLAVYGEVKDKNCLVVDDMASSGTTIAPSAEILLAKGAKKVWFLLVHPVFANVSQKARDYLQNSKAEKIIVSDSIEIGKDKLFSKLEIVSTAELLAGEIKKMI